MGGGGEHLEGLHRFMYFILIDNIQWQHPMESYNDIIQWQHSMITSNDNTQWQHLMTTYNDNI